MEYQTVNLLLHVVFKQDCFFFSIILKWKILQAAFSTVDGECWFSACLLQLLSGSACIKAEFPHTRSHWTVLIIAK